jgi:hypothetical protein
MRLKLIIFLGFLFLGSLNLNSQILKTLSVSGGAGIPVGKTNYPKEQFSSNAALFSNNGIVYNIGLEFTLKSSANWGYGILSKWNKYSAWSTNYISDRFKHSSLSTLDLGPMVYFEIRKSSNGMRDLRVLVVPFISYMKLSNPDNTYNLYSKLTLNDNRIILLTFQKGESLSGISQLLPGIYIAFDGSVSINEKVRLFARPGMTIMLAKANDYPDTYVLYPSFSVGYTFDNSRNKWFFIKEN